MTSDQEILSAVRTVQSELDTLLGAKAAQVAPELARLIAAVEAGQTDSFELEDFLVEYDTTRDRMRELLELPQDELIHANADKDKQYQRLPGALGELPETLSPTHKCSKEDCD